MSTTTPISPARFAEALKDLPLSSLSLKAAELRNSIAHLDYSNEQLKPFAEGTESACNGVPDQDCIDAIKENEVVIQRMEERIGLLRTEVEERGASWRDVLGGEIKDEEAEQAEVNGLEQRSEELSEAWRDGTFQTGRIVNGDVIMDGAATSNGTIESTGVDGNTSTRPNGTGGRLDDEALRRAMEERMRNLGQDDDEDGMHL